MRGTRFWQARRAVWRARRSIPRVARPLSLVVKAEAPERPIFVLGCPRSGTTLLLQALLQSRELRSVHSEGHILWDHYHHPRERGWDSDALGAEDISLRE
ncbi:MAG: sulfotransferase, partial [Gaiellaceae bacterium]